MGNIGYWHAIVLVSDVTTAQTSVHMVIRWLAQASVVLGGDSGAYIHRDSPGGSPYLTNKTGKATAFYVMWINGWH